MNQSYRQTFRHYQKLRARSEELSAHWLKLCRRFLPFEADRCIWRFSRARTPSDPEQGWKLHVSATILSACAVLKKVAPFLISRRTLFKAPVSLSELEKINAGLANNYAQIGKFLTVYPRSPEEALFLAERLHDLTLGMKAPAVPFDLQYRPGSCVFYRYGTFIDNGKAAFLRDHTGNSVPDDRKKPKPEWLSEDPFFSPAYSLEPIAGESFDDPLINSYRVFRALRQRGKGGVYRAIDLSVPDKPRLCVIKKGERLGELDWEGRDGFWRVRREAEVLKALESTGIEAPRVFDTFELDDSFFLAMESVEGRSLHELLKKRRRRFSIKQALKYAAEIAGLIARIHAAGWVWRDCKPSNIIVTAGGRLRPLDFEGGSRMEEPNIAVWQTQSFSPPFDEKFFRFETGEADDLYSLGAVVYYLLTAHFYQPNSPVSVEKLRRNVPKKTRELIVRLLSKDPRKRPSAADAAREFNLPAD